MTSSFRSRGEGNRTPLWSFGDSYSTDELHPYMHLNDGSFLNRHCYILYLENRIQCILQTLLRKTFTLTRVVICFTFRMLETSYAYVIYFVNHYRVSKFALQTS